MKFKPNLSSHYKEEKKFRMTNNALLMALFCLFAVLLVPAKSNAQNDLLVKNHDGKTQYSEHHHSNTSISMAGSIQAAQIQVSGMVSDVQGNTLPGVNIVIKGTTRGVVTDIDGNYSINVDSPSDVLVFSYIGYRPQEITVGDQRTINVVLTMTAEALEEVVVIGYGTQRRSDITGSVATVSSDELRERPAANLTQALQGRAPGLEVRRSSTRPGAESQMRIRGDRSLTATNDPLIVLDGIPFHGSIGDLNTANIESINVLKDASATAIYGSRGSNGVILITTRRGQAGEPRLSYNAYYGFSEPARYYNMHDAESFYELREYAGHPWQEHEIRNHEAGIDTDWQREVLQNGYMMQHDLSASGGTETARYSLSGGYFNETGVMPGQGYERYSLSSSVDMNIGKRIEIGLSTHNSLGIRTGESAGGIYNILSLLPQTRPRDDNGNLIVQPQGPLENYYNPLIIGEHPERWSQDRRRLRTFNTLFGKVNIYEGLDYEVNVGLDYRTDNYGHYYGSETPMRNGGNNEALVNNANAFNYTIDNILRYTNTFADVHTINFTGLFSLEEGESYNTRVLVRNLPADFVQYYNIQLGDYHGEGSNRSQYQRSGMMSYMGRINYNYDDRYLLTLTGRSDGSSRLAPGNKWHYYPALAFAWNIHNEGFMSGVDFLSELKLRAGYGQTSNQAITPYSTFGELAKTEYTFGTDGRDGYFVQGLANATLGWEFTTTTNLGLDFAMLNNRITGSLELYHAETEDILLDVNLPPSTGVTGVVMQNIGRTQNRGIEFNLRSVNISSAQEGGFMWRTNLNFYLNRNEILELQNPEIERDIGNGWFVGHPIDVIFDYNRIGIWQVEEAEEATGFRQIPGDIRVEDIAGGGEDGDEPDGRITDADRMIIGYFQPDFQFSLTNTFRFKGFDLTVDAYGNYGGMIVSQLHQGSSYLSNLRARRNEIAVDYWTPDNPDGEWPEPRMANPDAGTRFNTTLGYFDGTYVKISTITLGYTLPAQLLGDVGGRSLRFYVTVKDPFILFSDYVNNYGGVDAEPTGQRGTFQAGDNVQSRALVITANTPPTRSVMFGVNLNF